MKKLINQIKLKLATLAIALTPKSATAWKMKAEIEQRLFRYGEALSSYDKYLSLCSYDFKALTVVGALLNSLGDFEEAIVFFDKAIALHPGYVPAILNKGYAYSRLAKYEDAIACYDKILTIAVIGTGTSLHYCKALLNKGHALQFLGDEQNANQCYRAFERHLEDYPNDYETLYSVGWAMFMAE